MKRSNRKIEMSIEEILNRMRQTLLYPNYKSFIENTELDNAVTSLCNDGHFYKLTEIPYKNPESELLCAAIISLR